MDELALAADDLTAASQKDSIFTYLMLAGLGAGVVAVLLAFRSKE